MLPGEPTELREATLATMKGLGLIKVDQNMFDRFDTVRITPTAVQVARLVAEKEKAPLDLVEKWRVYVRSNRWTAVPIALVAVIIFLGSIIVALRAIGLR